VMVLKRSEEDVWNFKFYYVKSSKHHTTLVIFYILL
jgi:hypothetical protein